MGRVVLEEAQDTADDRVGEGPVPGRCLRLGAGEPGSQRGDDQREPFLDVRDIADVMVAALTSGERYVGRTLTLSGARLLTFGEAVAEIAGAPGRRGDGAPADVPGRLDAGLRRGTGRFRCAAGGGGGHDGDLRHPP